MAAMKPKTITLNWSNLSEYAKKPANATNATHIKTAKANSDANKD